MYYHRSIIIDLYLFLFNNKPSPHVCILWFSFIPMKAGSRVQRFLCLH